MVRETGGAILNAVQLLQLHVLAKELFGEAERHGAFTEKLIMERRSFLTYFGISWVASCFPLVLAASADAAKERRQEMTVAELDRAGSLKNGKILVVRNPADQTKLLAVNSTCTHNGCAVLWYDKEKSFVCPCHDSKFAPDGAVVNGPAKKPLKTYTAKIVGKTVVVTT